MVIPNSEHWERVRWLSLAHALMVDRAQLANVLFIGRNWRMGLNNWVGGNREGLSVGIHARAGSSVVRIGLRLVVPELHDEVAVRVDPELAEWWASLRVCELLLHVLRKLLQVEVNVGAVVRDLSCVAAAYAVLLHSFEDAGYLVVGHELGVPLDEQIVPCAYGVVEVEHADNAKMSGGIVFAQFGGEVHDGGHLRPSLLMRYGLDVVEHHEALYVTSLIFLRDLGCVLDIQSQDAAMCEVVLLDEEVMAVHVSIRCLADRLLRKDEFSATLRHPFVAPLKCQHCRPRGSVVVHRKDVSLRLW